MRSARLVPASIESMASRLALVVVVSLGVARGARAALPDPLGRTELYAFPGGVHGPAAARSAGLALADRWLGDEPFGNPAADPGTGVALTPMFARFSRQDLHAEFRQYDETDVFVDLAGGRLSARLGGVGVAVYASQPVFRREENAYTRGEVGEVPPPAVVAGSTTSRETRAGLALSTRRGRVGLGAAIEWTRRDDFYRYTEAEGVPDPGTTETTFEGDGWGGAIGLRTELPGVGGRPIAIGLAGRWVPALTLDVTATADRVTGATDSSFTVERDAGWEGGVSARWPATEAFALALSLGHESAREWPGFGVTTGPALAWSVAMEYHDARDPWTVRFGLGQELRTGVPEPRAGVIGLGLGWAMDATTIDFGLLHRTLARADSPTSFDDRLLVSVTVPFSR